MTNEELIAWLRDPYADGYEGHAADRIEQLVATNEALVKERDEALEWLSASQGYIADAVFALDKQEKAEARAERLEMALRVARVHVANNAEGWSVSRGAARDDLTIVDAALKE